MIVFYVPAALALAGLVAVFVGLRLSGGMVRRVVVLIGGVLLAASIGYGLGLAGLAFGRELSNAGMAALVFPTLTAALFAGGGFSWGVLELIIRSGKGRLMPWGSAIGFSALLLGGLMAVRVFSEGEVTFDLLSIVIVAGLFGVLMLIHFLLTRADRGEFAT